MATSRPGGLAFEVVPCVNPHGWVHNQRENARGHDVNWCYARDDAVAVQVLEDMARGCAVRIFGGFSQGSGEPGSLYL